MKGDTKRLFAKLRLGDVEDPVLYAAEPLIKWECSPEGKFASKYATDLEWNITPDAQYFGYIISVTGWIEEKYYLMYLLKFKDSANIS